MMMMSTDEATAFMGTLTCAAGTACTATVNADDTITVTGYTFTGSREAREAVAEFANRGRRSMEAANVNYLAFGVWIQEDVADGDNTADDPEAGAFAAGGSMAVMSM